MQYRGAVHEGQQYRPHARAPMAGLPPSASVLLPPSASASSPVAARAPASAVLPTAHVTMSTPAPAAPPSSVRATFPSSASVPLPGPPGPVAAAPAGGGVAPGFRAGGLSGNAPAPHASSAGVSTATARGGARTMGGAGVATVGGAGGAIGREDEGRPGAGRAAGLPSSPPHAQESFVPPAQPLQRGGPALSGGSFRSYSEASVDKDEPGMSC